MIQNIFEVLSPRERDIFLYRNRDKLTVKETAEKANCSVNTVKEYAKRIKAKIQALEDNGVGIMYGDQDTIDDISEIFNSETMRIGTKKTINQVQFFAQCSQMSCKGKNVPATPAERKMRSRNEELKKVKKRPMTKEERTRPARNVVPMPRPDRIVTRAYQQYQQNFGKATDSNEMASLEIILRSAGVIYRTPYINKINRRTSLQMRAQESGYEVVMVEAGEGKNVPLGSKYIETIKDENGNTEYSTWLFPSQFVCKKTKQKRKIV